MSSYPQIDFSALPAQSVPNQAVPLGYKSQAVVTLAADNAAATLTTLQTINRNVLKPASTITVASKALTLPTAAALVAAIPGAIVGTTFELTVSTGALGVANFGMTVTAGTGGSVVGAPEVGLNNAADSATFRVRLTDVTSGSENYVVYRVVG